MAFIITPKPIYPNVPNASGAPVVLQQAAQAQNTAVLLVADAYEVISLFGPTEPEKFAPMTSCLRIIRAQDFGGTEMDKIPLNVVTEMVDHLLAS